MTNCDIFFLPNTRWEYNMGIIKAGMQVAKIVMAVASLFNLNSIQQTDLNNYAKLQQYQ